PFTAVRVQDSFWSPRMETNRVTTVWYDFQKCEETGRIDNFAKAGKLMAGEFRGTPFDDSDVFKVIEGAAYTLSLHPDAKLDKYLDDLIAKIAAAQEPDGYLYTARTIDPKCRVDFFGPARWSKLEVSHELYNVGHLYEAAVAHFQATGKRSLLNVAIKSADLICKTFGPAPEQLKEPPGHQEIEIGLVRLFRVTGNRRYLDQAQFFCDIRGRADTHKLRGDYQQDHKPITEQDEAVGHSVRAGYFYSGVADVAALTGDKAYVAAIDRLWDNVVSKKMHLTGGIGASPGGEAFGANYDLPNASAYLETCAAIANALWNERMFLLHGDAKYLDVLERVIYNGFLSGVSITGDRFFYPNPLESDGVGKFNHGSNERAPWFGCSCCPVNDVRFIPEIASFVYATRGNDLFVNLFVGGSAQFDLNGTPIQVKQVTRYPWNGRIAITFEPAKAKRFTLNLRIPGWARNQPVPSDLYRYADDLNPRVNLALNGKPVNLKIEKGFARITRTWKPGDTVTLDLEMPVRRVVAHSAVKADRDRFAIERGPLVYCAEGADNGGKVLDKVFAGKVALQTEERPDLFGGIVATKLSSVESGETLTCIPYYAWCHRGPNEMRVWFPTKPEVKLASHCWEMDSVEACFDGKEPKRSNDQEIPRFTWWDHRGTTEWVLRRFDQPTTVSAVSVYWFDDTGSGNCRVPQNWRLFYLDGKDWKRVAGTPEFGPQRDCYNRLRFSPVTTTALRLEAQLQPQFSAGILEWKTE
ncbi:MAG TPA: glycoside hydrolase family 127 protein, partial [Clostridia bacterium]|nr:glycoside hydrolase family 127 protein [Clostridia bacterium]